MLLCWNWKLFLGYLFIQAKPVMFQKCVFQFLKFNEFFSALVRSGINCFHAHRSFIFHMIPLCVAQSLYILIYIYKAASLCIKVDGDVAKIVSALVVSVFIDMCRKTRYSHLMVRCCYHCDINVTWTRYNVACEMK